MPSKSPDAFRTISEVAEWLDTPAHVLRFWESKFTQVKPVKRAGGRRYYRPADMALLGGIKKLLHDDGMTIKGVQKMLREHGVKHVSSFSQPIGDEPAIEHEPAAPVDAGHQSEGTVGVADAAPGIGESGAGADSALPEPSAPWADAAAEAGDTPDYEAAPAGGEAALDVWETPAAEAGAPMATDDAGGFDGGIDDSVDEVFDGGIDEVAGQPADAQPEEAAAPAESFAPAAEETGDGGDGGQAGFDFGAAADRWTPPAEDEVEESDFAELDAENASLHEEYLRDEEPPAALSEEDAPAAEADWMDAPADLETAQTGPELDAIAAEDALPEDQPAAFAGQDLQAAEGLPEEAPAPADEEFLEAAGHDLPPDPAPAAPAPILADVPDDPTGDEPLDSPAPLALLAALPRGALAGQAAEIAPLAARMRELRDRLREHRKS